MDMDMDMDVGRGRGRGHGVLRNIEVRADLKQPSQLWHTSLPERLVPLGLCL